MSVGRGRGRRGGGVLLRALLSVLLVGGVLAVVSGVDARPVEAQSVSAGGAVLHRDEIVEGQTRDFEISNIAVYPAYFLRIKALGAPWTAEAGDLSASTDDRRGRAQAITPGSDGERAFLGTYSKRGIITFEVAAHADGDSGDETFGVQLCTTASCTGGTVLGEWTVAITEPAADTALSGTGSTVTIGGGSAVSVMESSRNGDSRDRRATFTVNVTTAPTADIVIVAKASAGVTVGTNADGTAAMGPIARVQGGLSLDNQPSAIGLTANLNFDAVAAEYVVGYWAAGATGSRTVTVYATDNVADTAGGTLRGSLEFRVLNDDAAYRTNGIHKRHGGTGTDSSFGNATVYSGITVPNVPIAVTDDDEPTRVRVLAASSADSEATEGSSTDTAKFRVMLGRALAGSEEVTVPLRFSGAALGTNFTLALDGSPTGASYADSSDGTEGRLTFSGAGARTATVVVTAISDSDSVSETLNVFIPQYSDPWRADYIETNLDGGACAGTACPGVGSGDAAARGYQVTLREATAGLTVIDTGDGRVGEGGAYSYTVRLNTAPTANVTVAVTSGDTSKATVAAGASLTFTPSGAGAWNVPQTVTVAGADDNTDAADASVTFTHDVTGSGAYASIADVTHGLTVVDDDATVVTMAGTGLRTSPSATNISNVMVEGDTVRVDRSLTITLSRPLEDGEYVKVPLYVEATGHPATPYVECDISGSDVPPDNWSNCEVISSPRGVRVSANVAWPPHYNDFTMTATGAGVSYQHVPRVTFNHNGYRYVEFRGAGAQTATVEMHARGFDDGDAHNEEFRIEFANDFEPLNTTPPLAYSLKPITNLGGGIEAWTDDAEVWFAIADANPAPPKRSLPLDSPLVPPGLNVDDTFRLLYVTNAEFNALDRNQSTYDTFVRNEITHDALKVGGVNELKPHADAFFALVTTLNSTGGTNPARDSAKFNMYKIDAGEQSNAPIYWVGGDKVADNASPDFIDGSWDSESPRYADGTAAAVDTDGYWTGGAAHGHRTNHVVCSGGTPSHNRGQAGEPDAHVGYLDGTDNKFAPLGPKQNEGACADREPSTETRAFYALSDTHFTVIAAGGVTVGGTDTDDNGAAVRTPFASAAEGSAVVFTVTLPAAAPSGGITVPYTLADGLGITTDPAYTVARSADYTDGSSGAITIAQGDTTGTITVNTANDNTYEGDHYFRVTLGTPTGTNPPSLHSTHSTATGVITDDADAPTIGFSAATASVAENISAGTVTLTVSKTGTTLAPSAVTWTTADGTGGSAASHPGDYTADTGIIEFAAGETSKTITVDIADDDTAESDETFTVTLSEPVDATLGSQASATVTVTDDDGGATDVMVTWSQTDDTALPPAPDLIEGQTYTVKVSLSSPAPAGGVTIPISVLELTGADSADYTVPAGVTIAAGQTSTTFDFVAVADENAEANGLLILTLCPAATCPMGYTSGKSLSFIIKDPDVVTVVTDDDGNPLEVVALNIDEGASDTFTVKLEIDPVADATITLKAVDDSSVDLSTLITSFGSAAATDRIAFDTDPDTPGNQTTLTFTGGNGGNWNIARTVTIYALYDDDVDTTATTDYTVGFLNSAASGPYKEQVFFTRVPLGVRDAGKAVVVDPATVSVATSGTVTYDIQLASDPGGSVTVTPTSGDATKATVTGEAKTFTSTGATAWNVPQQVTVTGVGAGTSTITHAITTGTTDYPTSGSGITLPSVEATVTASTVPEVTIAADAATATEGTDTASFTITADPAPTGSNTITVNVDHSGAADYGAADASVMLPIDSLGTISLTNALTGATDDAVDEPNGTWTATIQAATDGSYEVGSANTATVTLIDDDPTVVSLARVDSGNIAEGGSGLAADAEFTVTLGRRLMQGETVEVPLVISGTNVTASDVMVKKKTNARGRITVNGGGTLTPTVTFMGHDTNVIRTETLVLTALVDGMAGEAAETITVALGPNDTTTNGFDETNRATNVGGGADPHGTANTFNVGVDAGVHLSMAVSGSDANNNAVENAGDATEYVTITLTLDRVLTGSETVTVPLTVRGATVTDDYTFALEPSTQTGVSLTTTGGTHSAQNPAVEFASGATSATLRLTAVNNSDRSQPAVSVAYGTGGRAPSAGGGVTLGARTGSPITVVLVDDETGAIIVPADWALKPAGVAAGEEFRLLFVTTETRTAESMDINEYNAWVQNLVARNGHAQLKEYGGLVKALGSTSSSHARSNTGMWSGGAWADGSTTAMSAGTEIYWLRTSPNFKVGDNYFDFCDASWDGNQSEMRTNDRTESGAQRSGTGNIWTGTQQNCTRDSQTPLGGGTGGWANRATFGSPYFSASGDELDRSFVEKVNSYAMYGMSPVFQVAASGDPVISIARGSSQAAAVAEGATLTYTVTADPAPSASLTVSLEVMNERAGRDMLAAGEGGLQSVTFAMGETSKTYTVDTVADMVDEANSRVMLSVASGSGYTAHPTSASAMVIVRDDDNTGLAITQVGDGTVNEGSHVEYTVDPGRDLLVGETLTLALQTGHTDWTAILGTDYTVTCHGTGVTCTALTTDEPTLRVVGGTGVRRATVRYTALVDAVHPEADETVGLRWLLLGNSLAGSGGSLSLPSSVPDSTIRSGGVDVVMSVSGGDANGNAAENQSDGSEYVTITLTLDRALTGSETITVPLTVSGATVATDYTFALEPSSQTGISLTTTGGAHTAQNPAVAFASGARTATLRLTAVNNAVRTQPLVSIAYGTGSRAPTASSGIALGDVTGSPITVALADDETGDIEVPASWALAPSGLSAGDTFRLIFITSETRTAESTDIEDYNDWAQELVARLGHTELQKYGGLVKVLGSTASTDARVNLGMYSGSAWADGSTSDTDSGVKIYWLAAPPTNKVADNYFDFFDRSWDGGASGGSDQTSEATIESGAARSAYTQIFSGTNTDGTADTTSPFGGTRVWIGETDGGNGGAVIFTGASTLPNTDSERMIAMSPVFQVEAAAAPVISVELATQEGARTPTGEVAFGEGEGGITPINFPVTADPAPTANLTVCVEVAESGHGGVDRVASSAERVHTVTITNSGSVEHMVAYSNTAVDEPDSIVTVTVLAPETAGCSAAAGSYTVSTTNPSDKARITDDEATDTELTSSDTGMLEGIPAGTAEVTVSLARRLYDGEVMEIELRLSTDTGAVLPHVASPDFTVSSATGSGVALSDATTAAAPPNDAQTAPKITFTGDNTNTVQSATVTFAPTTGRDSDSDDETITVSLAPSIVLRAATGSNVGGKATRHASSYEVDLTLAEAVAVSVTELRVAENGGTATYEVRLLTAPSGGNTTVTIAKANGTVNPDMTAATLTDKDGNVVSTLTFTPTDFADAQVVTVTGVDELSVFDMANDSPTYRDRTLVLSHTASGGGYSSQSLGDIDVTVQEAPQIEAYTGRIWTVETPGPYRNGLPARHTLGVALQTDVFSTMDFFVRASDRPVGGTPTVDGEPSEPITVILTVASTYTREDLSSVRPRSSDRGPLSTVNGSVIGMQLTRSSPIVQTLTLTFHDRPISSRGCGILFNDDGEMGDGTPDSSFECPRIVYLVKTNPAFIHGCQDIDVTVSGGSVRTGGDYGSESITVHFWNGNRQIINDKGGGYKSACSWDSVVPGWSDPRPEPRTEYCVLGGRVAAPTAKSCFHFVDNLSARSSQADTGWAPDGAHLVHEGSSARYEIDLGVTVQNGQSYELELKPAGATMGDDYTLTLDTDNSPHVSVDPDHPLDSAAPRLIFAPGARVASIVVTAVDDAVHEREVLTIGYGEYRYKTTGRPDKVSYPKAKALFALIDSTPLVPDTPVANLAVTADDATTATASWDPVAGATAYNVSYQGNGADPLNNVSAAVHGHTATTWTFAHNAAEPDMVITVTVTPVRTAGDGTTTVYHSLSSAADLDLAAAPACVPDLPADAVTVAEAAGWRDAHSGAAHVLRWNRVLEALGEDTGTGQTAMTVAESEANEDTFMRSRWDRVTRTLEAVAECDDTETATTVVPPPADPEISIASGGDITEGGNAVFTVTADPAPTAPLDVTVTITAVGDFGATSGAHTVTIGTAGTGTLTVATAGDSADEPDGSITAAVSTGAGYTVSATAGTAAAAVADDDDPPPPPPPVCTPDLPDDAVTVAEVTGWRDAHSHDTAHVQRWNQVLEALGDDTGTGATAMTVNESKANEDTFMRSRWDRVTRTLAAYAQCDDTDTDDDGTSTDGTDDTSGDGTSTGTGSTDDGGSTDTDPPPPPPVEPEISITAGNGVVEGGSATFTLSASPPPSVPLSVEVTVSSSGDFGAATGPRTVTIPTSGTVALTVSTSDDSIDEADGSVTVTVDDADGYTVSASAGAASAAITDNDDPPPPPPPPDPEISITAGGDITEGGSVTFTLTASPAPSSPLTVHVSVAQTGDFGVTTGSRQVTIPASGTGTLSVATSDDSTDEPDGSVTVAVDDGSGYAVSAAVGTATVGIADDDDPPATLLPPSQVSFSAEDASAAEGEVLRFRIMLSDAANARVRVYWRTRYSYAGETSAFPDVDYPSRARGWIAFEPGEVEKWVDIALPDDKVAEPDEVFQIYLSFTEGGATIADRDATMTITDND